MVETYSTPSPGPMTSVCLRVAQCALPSFYLHHQTLLTLLSLLTLGSLCYRSTQLSPR